MAVKTFTMPTPLDTALKSADNHSTASDLSKNDAKRSEKGAKQTAEAYSTEKKEPLASSKSAESKPGITFAAQDRLPKLPIPDLEQTCKKYIEALDPLQTQREHNDTEAAVREFLRSEGPELQERLKKYSTGKSSYIEQFCTCRHSNEFKERNMGYC